MADYNQYIEPNLALVHACCHRLKGRGVEYEELYAAGCVGLVKAAKGFDASRGLQFSTYAVPVILGEIRRLFRDGGAVKVGRALKELSLKVTRTRERLTISLSREPTVAELAQALDVSAEDVAQALCAAQPTVSLTWEDEDGMRELDLPAADEEEHCVETLSLKEALGKLPEEDRALIVLRYYQSKTQTETAARLGMTQVQVSRKEKAILTKMKALLS